MFNKKSSPHKNKPQINIYKAHLSFCTVRADANGIIRYKVNINTQAGWGFWEQWNSDDTSDVQLNAM